MLYCDLAETYYLLYPVQVNALALQFTNLLLILALCLLDFCFFISSWDACSTDSESHLVFSVFPARRKWNNSLWANADITFCSDICKQMFLFQWPGTLQVCVSLQAPGKESKKEKWFKTLVHEAIYTSQDFPMSFLTGRDAIVGFPSGHGLTISPVVCSRYRNCVYTYRILPDKENKLIVQVSHLCAIWYHKNVFENTGFQSNSNTKRKKII